MLIQRGNLLTLPFVLVALSNSLYAWGDGDKLSDGSCQFDRETGYQSSALYIKGNESFLIVNGGDSKYGTISTIYNAQTCEKVTSGDPIKSDYEGLMSRKGFVQSNLGATKVLDDVLKHKISFKEDSENIKVYVENISSVVTQELNSLLTSISDKSASSQIVLSSSAQELVGYAKFSNLFLEKLNSLPTSEVNYDYALALNKKLNNHSAEGILLAGQEEVRQKIAKLKAEEKARLAQVEATLLNNLFTENVKSIKDVPKWKNKMIELGKQDRISQFVPNILKLSDFGKTLTLNNFLSSIEYKYIFKDMKLNRVTKIENYDKAYGIYLDYKDKAISLTKNPTCISTGRTSTDEFSCGFFWANTCVGTYKHYKCKAGDTSSIATIERQLKGTTKIATALNKGWTFRRRISRYTKSTPNYSSSSSSRKYQEQQEQQELMKQQKNTARKSCLAMCEGVSTEGKGIIWDNSPQRKCKDRCWKI